MSIGLLWGKHVFLSKLLLSGWGYCWDILTLRPILASISTTGSRHTGGEGTSWGRKYVSSHPKKGQTGHKLSLLGSHLSLFIMQESNVSLLAPPLKYRWRSSLRNYRIPQKRVKATSLPAACLLVVLSKMRTNRLNEDLAFGQHCRPTNLRRNCLRPRRVDSLI